MDDVVSEATSFIAACYGSRTKGDLSEIRYKIWASKMANTKITSAPKLKLPPTNKSFVEHVRRAHHQTATWKGSLSPDPPQMDPVQYGWSRGEDNSPLSPIMLPANVSPVPVDVLQMIKCGCSSERSCSTGRCGCVVANMSCSMLCCCHAGPECNKCHTRNTPSFAEGEDSD